MLLLLILLKKAKFRLLHPLNIGAGAPLPEFRRPVAGPHTLQIRERGLWDGRVRKIFSASSLNRIRVGFPVLARWRVGIEPVSERSKTTPKPFGSGSFSNCCTGKHINSYEPLNQANNSQHSPATPSDFQHPWCPSFTNLGAINHHWSWPPGGNCNTNSRSSCFPCVWFWVSFCAWRKQGVP
jgi:hypothetical protein